MSLEYQLRRQMEEMQLQLGLLSSELTEMKRRNDELTMEKLNWERKSKTLEEKNKALTHKTGKLEAMNKVLNKVSKMLISKLQNANEKRSNLAEFVAILQENLLELEHTSQVKSDSLQKNMRFQQDRARKLKSALLEMIGDLTNFASDMRRKEQHLPTIGTNNIEDTQIQEFVAWANIMPSIHQLGTAPAQFQLRTGNINGNLELKCTNFSNSAEELEQWIALQSEDSINDNMEDDRMTLHSRNDLKVTFKIFMTKWEVESIEKAIEALKEKLKIKDIEVI
ncbi:Protein CBG08917 [Caenorhabditis briggsae]|uniref:Protein CBG08917 n=1 Tax=Caenorhabditis briggsae TaxID=6238 RepID=A8X7P3_CAEBR|nr:Protein CBG08917 [Caenorhabditis briggsae]CAP28654.2 Protein CBG08917 [Caenorhabditis briggsae]